MKFIKNKGVSLVLWGHLSNLVLQQVIGLIWST